MARMLNARRRRSPRRTAAKARDYGYEVLHVLGRLLEALLKAAEGGHR